jgi:hypothetical protein
MYVTEFTSTICYRRQQGFLTDVKTSFHDRSWNYIMLHYKRRIPYRYTYTYVYIYIYERERGSKEVLGIL